ncbi:diphthine synthase [Candidatus Bathyarchaeota archaeon]|nr:diphthine synthase [Candidatus Bathyarchaeota archaeon]
MLTFIGLGLHSELGISLEGLEEARRADIVFAEFYTSHMPGFSLGNLERLIGKRVQVLSRMDLEDEAERKVLEPARRHRCVLLTPGDPNVATTHIALRLKAEKEDIRTFVIHAASVASAVAGVTGLQSYKFGRTVTIPFKSTSTSEIPYEHICENMVRGLHSLALLDIDSEAGRYMTVNEGLEQLLDVEDRRGFGWLRLNRPAVGVARIGSKDMKVKADTIGKLGEYDWGGPPHCLIFPGRLHFMEAEALQILCGADMEILRGLL